MYKQNQHQKTTLRVNKSIKGETIEQKIHRILNNKEPITDGAPIVYTERKDGVKPEYDIRTDRFEIAVEKTDYITKSHIAERENRIKEFQDKLDEQNGIKKDKKDGGPESIGGTK